MIDVLVVMVSLAYQPSGGSAEDLFRRNWQVFGWTPRSSGNSMSGGHV